MLAITISKTSSLEFLYVKLHAKYGDRNIKGPKKRER